MPHLTLVDDSGVEEDLIRTNDPVLNAPIYFGRKSSGLAGKKISEYIFSVNQQRKPDLYRLSYDQWEFVNRPITSQAFKVLLRYYENNQYYYLEHDEWDSLLDLEIWFIQVVEPPPNRRDQDAYIDWLNRESIKLRGYTYYCDLEVKAKIKIPSYVMLQVKLNRQYLFTLS